jgi:hypothetical protein
LKCPRCGDEKLVPPDPCPNCSFSGPPVQIEELGHVRYLLKELAGWQDLGQTARDRLRARYLRRQRQLEIELGLRPPPLSPEEARDAAKEILRLQQLVRLLNQWHVQDWIEPGAADDLATRTHERISEVRARLAEPDTPRDTIAIRPSERVALLRSLRDEADRLRQEGGYVNEEAYQAAVADLEKQAEQMEIRLGLRPRPKEKPAPVSRKPAAPAVSPRPPREPITWERIWHTLLSERTLRVLLFVGVFLIFVSAVTLVVYNWERFHPWVQVAFLSGFTLFFYGLGWYVRAKMGLQKSGIALFATGSLLVPVDFYAVYLSGGLFPREAWAEVWLLASVVCLGVYTILALILRAEFFGYLVGTACGSLICAALQVTGVSTDWWSLALCGLALLMLLPAQWLERSAETSRRHVFGRPFRHLALLTTTSVLLIATGLRVAQDIARFPFRLALALDWWLACVVYTVVAARHPRRTLASAASVTAPVAMYLALGLWFEPADISAAWHALGWALLTPIYLAVGRALRGDLSTEESETQSSDAPGKARQMQGRIVIGWAVLLMILAAGWGFIDMSAAAAAHAVLAGSVALAVTLWRKPSLLVFASLLSLSATTTWMTTQGLDLAQFCLGWALLAILHVIAAILLRRAERYTPFLYAAAFVTAGLSLLPPLVTLDRNLMAYALGNWIALCGWAAWLAHGEKHPGLPRLLRLAGPLRQSVLHWMAALPLPFWFWLVWTESIRPADAWLGIGFAAPAWVCLGLGRRLARQEKAYGLPWHTISFVCSVVGPAIVGGYYDQPLLALTLLGGAALYFLYAYLFRFRWWLLLGGLTLPFAYSLALDHLGLPPNPLATSLVLVPTAYIAICIWLERRRQVTSGFLEPLYGAAHLVAAAAFLWGFTGLWNRVAWDTPWTDAARLWAAGGQLVLGVTYGLAAWFLEGEAWGHVAAWLGVFAGGLVATAYSQGRGSSAAKAAALAALYVLPERGLHVLHGQPSMSLQVQRLYHRLPKFLRQLVGFLGRQVPRRAWPLYRRPLLIAGWAVSGGAVALALLRNLVLLGGGPGRENWAIVGLLLIVALYAGSARLFRRPLFLWLAAPLLFAPWTILTHRGWYVWATPPGPHYARAWAALACVLLPVGLLLDRRVGKQYGFPLRVTAHVLLPFALLWGAADAATSSLTFGLGMAFYVLAAVADHRQGYTGRVAARFAYPAALLVPVWAVYLLAWLGPWLPHAHFGLLLLALALPLFAAAHWWLRRIDPADALPAYLASYGCAIVGTTLVSYDQPMLALALTFDAGLALLSAWLLREPLWIYPAAALPPAALLMALAEFGFNLHRRGWWLIGLGVVYLAQAWALRRCALPLSPPRAGGMPRRGRGGYATPLMAAAYAVVALGLAIASYEQTAALWAYSAAVLIYAASAAWLRQPLLLTPAAALAAVPYAIVLGRAAWIAPADYGLALWPGIAVALAVAHLLDRYLGAPRDFPWNRPGRWFPEAAHRLADWWGLPLYVWGYVAALVGVGLSSAYPDRLALALLLTAIVYGLAVVRFRLRGWLLASVAAAQLAALALIWAAACGLLALPQAWVERLSVPAWQALAFLPVTLTTAVAGLWIEWKRGEGSPFASLKAAWQGWSRPLCWLLVLDLAVVQTVSVARAQPGMWVSLIHALLLTVLAVIWVQPMLPYLATGLGLLTVFQRLTWVQAPTTDPPWALALLALGYGVVGYGLEYSRRRENLNLAERFAVLERPLERAGLAISALSILWMLAVGIDIWRWLARALIGRPVMAPEDVPTVQMAVAVLALVGLLYLAAALVRRWFWRGYGAVAVLLCAWSLEWFLVWDLREVQWYAIPAGLYLLGVGYLEWRQGRKGLARWIDRAALLLLLGSSFYQSLAEDYGWSYALLMGAESLLLIWCGSARRQRRFLYFGVVGVVTDVGGQLIEPLLSVNRWIVFGGVGLFVIALAILVERSLEAIKKVSQEWRERLEEWD